MMIDLLQITDATECLFFPENKECTREDGIMAIAENRHARARPQLDRLARGVGIKAGSGGLHGWLHVSMHENGAGLTNSWMTVMLGNVGHARLSMKQEGMCGGYGKDGPGRAMQQQKARSTMIGTFGLENRLRDGILGWLTLIPLPMGGPGKLDSNLRIMMTDSNECFYVFLYNGKAEDKKTV
ncbi:hypothetical protein J3F84DRAFT_215710 [Trichoderma pleuroticola]